MSSQPAKKYSISAKWINNPKQGWSGWLASVRSEGACFYLGKPSMSFCDAIDAASKALRQSAPGCKVSVSDPSPAQKRKQALATFAVAA